MKKTNIVVMTLQIFLVILIGLGLAYHFRDRRTYEISIPEIGNLTRITIQRNAKGVDISDVDIMKEIRDTLYGIKRITEKESVQDSPINVDNEIKIDFFVDENLALTIFVYRKNNKYYIEQPYNGIYRISPDEYNSIEKYVR